MTVKEFVDRHINRYYDVDNYAGVQCVDAFKLFTLENYGISNYNCTNGYASGLWIYRKDKPYYNYFIEVDKNRLQNGDWVIWDKCNSCPMTHVAMYYNGKFFSQNQNGSKAFNLVDISLDGVIGVLRPKMYVDKAKIINIPEWIEERNIYDIYSKKHIGCIKPKKFGGLSYRILNYVDDFVEIQTINFGKVLVKVTDATKITNDPIYTHGNF